MSTTIIAQPQQLMPAYNPIKYIIDNTNKNEPGVVMLGYHLQLMDLWKVIR
jgi:hypothetical protein